MTDLSTFTGCPPVTPLVVTGQFVRVSPYEPAMRDGLFGVFGNVAGTNDLLRYFTQDDFTTVEEFGAWIDRGVRSGWMTHVFSKATSGMRVGLASYMRADPANGVVEVGAVAHSTRMQRTPMATEAHYLMARHVFETLGYRRYEWKCHHANEPSKTAALRYGFTFEGVFRQHMVSKHANRDTWWYAMIDEDWPRIKAGFERWLAPENFDERGAQRQTLQALRDVS